jgi:hypothetical protein
MSKRSRKKIYGLNPTAIAILRYIADSIDLSKSDSTRLYKSQIAKQNHTSVTTVWRAIVLLRKKRMIKYYPEIARFELGVVPLTYFKLNYPIEVVQVELPPRSSSNRTTSYSSNFTNKSSSTSHNENQDQKIKKGSESGYASVENQSTSARPLEYVRASSETVDKAMIEIRRAVGLRAR